MNRSKLYALKSDSRREEETIVLPNPFGEIATAHRVGVVKRSWNKPGVRRALCRESLLTAPIVMSNGAEEARKRASVASWGGRSGGPMNCGSARRDT
mgnify:FL=1